MELKKFHVTLQKEPQGGYSARCLELPGALSEGETEKEILAKIKDAILTIIDMMERARRQHEGERIPTQQRDNAIRTSGYYSR